MNLTASLALLVASVGLLFFGRGRDGDALPFLQKGDHIAPVRRRNISLVRRRFRRSRVQVPFMQQPTWVPRCSPWKVGGIIMRTLGKIGAILGVVGAVGIASAIPASALDVYIDRSTLSEPA